MARKKGFQRFPVLWKGTEEYPGEIAIVEGMRSVEGVPYVCVTLKGESGYEKYEVMPMAVFNRHRASLYQMAVLYLEERR